METELIKDDIGIRRSRAEDIPLLYEAVRESFAELDPWMPWVHPGYSADESSTWILSQADAWQKGTDYNFIIFEPSIGSFLGVVGLNKIDRVHQSANLGYWVRSSSTRRGVASTAARLLGRFGLEQLGFQRLEIVAAVGNRASQRVAEKAGAQREGILRKGLRYHNVPHDAVLFSLVAEDIRHGEW